MISTDRRKTLSKSQNVEFTLMNQRNRRAFTATEKAELSDRRKRAEALKSIGRALGTGLHLIRVDGVEKYTKLRVGTAFLLRVKFLSFLRGVDAV